MVLRNPVETTANQRIAVQTKDPMNTTDQQGFFDRELISQMEI